MIVQSGINIATNFINTSFILFVNLIQTPLIFRNAAKTGHQNTSCCQQMSENSKYFSCRKEFFRRKKVTENMFVNF